MYKKIKEFADKFNQKIEVHHLNGTVNFMHRDGSYVNLNIG
jgi:hypothetical protein